MRIILMTLMLMLALLNTDGKKSRLRGIKWWALGNLGQPSNEVLPGIGVKTPVYLNPSMHRLTRKQRRLVNRNPGTLLAIARGAKLAKEECQHQFRQRRWNCNTLEHNPGNSLFGKILRKGCRETAFVYAITSAAVAYHISRGCADGSIFTCGCGRSKKRPPLSTEWNRGGCSDNSKFGHKFARKFVDGVEKGRDFRYMMNLHNNEAGRVHVSANMNQQCKCHGMSGSCTIKTCWLRHAPFRQVGYLLKDRFDGASRVLPGNSGSGRGRKRRKFNFIPVNRAHKPPNKKDLVYFENSPDFCSSGATDADFDGTEGRQCNATSMGIDGCDLMCCGRGFKSESFIQKYRCSCTFHWCCKVNCKTCTRLQQRHTCT